MQNNTTTAVTEPTPNGGEGQHLPNETYLQYVKRQFRKNRLARTALYFTYFMFCLTIFADFLANDRPLAR
ncbi:MAG: hypothetical protein DYG96_09385 [Chlorobi bacterium CHB2]|nr:hypothetical protein [Chlorobi bacterium CHB2]